MGCTAKKWRVLRLTPIACAGKLRLPAVNFAKPPSSPHHAEDLHHEPMYMHELLTPLLLQGRIYSHTRFLDHAASP